MTEEYQKILPTSSSATDNIPAEHESSPSSSKSAITKVLALSDLSAGTRSLVLTPCRLTAKGQKKCLNEGGF